jgi:hypothetical protein
LLENVTMRSLVLAATAGALAALVLTADPAQAQVVARNTVSVSRGSFELEGFGGYLLTQKFIDGPFGTNIGMVNAPMYGVHAGLPLAPGASLVGTIAYASGNLQAGLPIIGGISVGNTEAYIYDASVQLRADTWEKRPGVKFIPLAQLGAGAMHRNVTVAGFTAKATNFEVSGGLGADIPMTRDLALRLMAKDYYAKADFGSLGSLQADTKYVHSLALTGGLRYTF